MLHVRTHRLLGRFSAALSARTHTSPVMLDVLIIVPTVLGFWAPVVYINGFLLGEPFAHGGTAAEAFALEGVQARPITLRFAGVPLFPGREHLVCFGIALTVLATLAAFLRRRAPGACAVAAVSATAVAKLFSFTSDLGVLCGLCLVTLAERRGRRGIPWWAVFAASAVAVGVFLLYFFFSNPLDTLTRAMVLLLFEDGILSFALDELLLGCFVLAMSWEIGVHSRERREHAARQAELAERVRIRRDVHDVLSHSLSTIGVRAGVAAQVRGLGEEAVYELLADIERVCREGLRELRGVLDEEDVLGGDAAAAAPLPQVLSGMVERARETGLRVQLDIDERLMDSGAGSQGMPVIVGTALYRLVQEALTNIMRHAGARACVITVRDEPNGIEVYIRDDGVGAARLVPGNGLRGMRERISQLGGELHIDGDPDGGGFAIRAHVPIWQNEKPELERRS